MNKIKRLSNKFFSIKILNDSFWSLSGNVLAKGLALASGILVARLLGKDVFGEYGILKNTIVTIAIFSTFGLGYTSTKFISEIKNYKPELLPLLLKYFKGITLTISGITALVVFFISDILANKLFNAPQISSSLRIISVLIIASALISTQLGILSGFGTFKRIARIDAIVGIISFLSTIVLTYFLGLNGALGALFFTQVLNYFLNQRLINKIISGQNNQDNLKPDKKLFNEILKFSLPIALQEAVYSISQWTMNILLIRFATLGDLGMFTAAMQWNSIILFIPGVLRSVILSHLSEANNDEAKHKKIMKITLSINFFVVIVCVLVVLLLSNSISGLYGHTFNGLNQMINIAVFSTIFTSLSNVYAQAYMSKGLNWTMFTMRFIRDFGAIGLFFILTRFLKINSVLLMLYSLLILSFVFFVIMALYYSRKSTVKFIN